MRQPRFNIKKFTKNGHTFYGIFVPARINPSGKECYFYYHTKAEAELKKQELLSATSAENRAHVLSRVQIIDAQRALERLESEGLALSLTQAVEAALPHLKASAASVEVDALLGEFAQVKAEGWSALSARNFATVSKVFLAEFAGRKLASITVKDLQAWLSTRYASAASRAFAVRTLRPAWSYAMRQGHISESPWARLEREKRRAKDEIDIYTPAEARRLLACAPPDFQAAFAILLFAGVRPVELTRLVWADVRDGFIRIRASISKTQQARLIPIEATLAPFLASRGADDARVIPPAWRARSMAIRAAAGLSGRPDAARHSYATYFLARGGSLDALKANMGHSRGSDTLFVHYRAAVTPAQAAEYWSITPDAVSATP